MQLNLTYGAHKSLVLAACTIFAILAGVSCVQGEPPITDASIAGTLTYRNADVSTQASGQTRVYGSALMPVAAGGQEERMPFSLSSTARGAPFVPGEAIVKFTGVGIASAGAEGPLRLMAAGRALSRSRALSLPATGLYVAPGAGRQETLVLIDALNALDDVAYAQPNYLLEPALEPSDELYPAMWHYPMIGLERAWDTTTGSSATVVAVIDTGMLMNHPDRPVNLMDGYDFVSNPDNRDGDGRDSDPTDPGPDYHGSHVIGTIAAAANNDYDGDPDADGIAGVNWSTRILPVRALGATGETADIVDAIMWSAGEPISGVPDNANPADVILMSFGGEAACSQSPAYQDAIDKATAAGSIPVAAAGNQNRNAADFTPASCAGVITVGASDRTDERAPYSNWGTTVDLMAPGGDLSVQDDPDGVLSLGKDSDAFTFRFDAGTSMAAAHVAGVISLMLAIDPGLSADGVMTILSDTAESYSSLECDAGDQNLSLSGSDCGAGRIDAFAAMQKTEGTLPPPPPPSEPGELSFSPTELSFATTLTTENVILTNTGSTMLEWELVGFSEDPANPSSLGGVFTADPGSGTLAENEDVTMRVTLDRSTIETAGTYVVDFLFDTDGDVGTAEASLTVTFSIVSGDSGDPSEATGPSVVCAQLVSTGRFSGSERSDGVIRDYRMSVEPGENEVFAWSDENGNGAIDAGDFYGAYPSIVTASAGEVVTGIDITLDAIDTSIGPRACFR